MRSPKKEDKHVHHNNRCNVIAPYMMILLYVCLTINLLHVLLEVCANTSVCIYIYK